MNRNRTLALESLEGKMLLSGATAHAALVGSVQVAPAPGVTNTPSNQSGTFLPHGPSNTTGFTPFAAAPSSNYLPHGPSNTTGFTAF